MMFTTMLLWDRGVYGQTHGADRRYRVKPGVWKFACGFSSDIHTSRSRVTNTTRENKKESI